MNLKRVAVLGGGSFGTALAELCARRYLNVTQWVRRPEHVQEINENHRNPKYLSDFELNARLKATTDPHEAVSQADWVIVAVPSQVVRSVMADLQPSLREQPLVLACKGIEKGTLLTMGEVIADVLGAPWENRTLALSGPSFARELMQMHPTAVVLAGKDAAMCEAIGHALFCDYFRAYHSDDLIGVELGGALKNVIAIAAGAISGLGLGQNSRAAMITRGLAEITRLAVAKGANPLTLAGLAGMGDLVLTCTGGLSRNRAIGQALGEGLTLDEAIEKVQQVAEGIETTASAYALAQKLGVECRIIHAVYSVLYEDVPAREALLKIVRREPGKELDT